MASQVVVEHDHVVAVPADAAADVQQDLRQEQQHRRDLVGDASRSGGSGRCRACSSFCRVQRVAEVELVRADDVALAADAEQLAFDRVEVVAPDRSAPRRSRRATRSAARAGPTRSTGVSFMPSGIQTFVTQGVPSALPIAARDLAARDAVARSRTARMPSSRCDSVKPSAAFGCEKNVGLKSRPMPSDFAQSIQPAKCSGRISSRSTPAPPNSP